MNSRTRVAVFASLAALGSFALCAQAFGAKPITKTYTKGVGGEQGGTPIVIPDGGGASTQLVRSPLTVKKLNPRGNIKDVDVSVRASHPFAADLEFYLASPRGVLNLSSDNGGSGNNYGGGSESCQGVFTVFDSDNPTLISTPTLEAPFLGSYAPEESLNVLDKLGGKKATNATWSLLVEDDSNTHAAGTLFCWQLKIKQTNPKR